MRGRKSIAILPSLAVRPASSRYTTAPRTSYYRQPFCRNTLQARPFSSNLIPTQTLAASRILPYPAHEIFHIIADIASYPAFIPYLQTSQITSHSSPDSTQKRQWPRTANLHVGYGPYSESFTSRVYCLPYRTLEAVAGEAEPTIPPSSLPHYYDGPNHPPEPKPATGDLFTSLLTRWSFREFPFKPEPPDGPPQEGNAEKTSSQARTEVGLHIEVKFASAMYAALSQAAAPKVAGLMVEAFEKRAREVLGRSQGEGSSAEKDADRRSALTGNA